MENSKVTFPFAYIYYTRDGMTSEKLKDSMFEALGNPDIGCLIIDYEDCKNVGSLEFGIVAQGLRSIKGSESKITSTKGYVANTNVKKYIKLIVTQDVLTALEHTGLVTIENLKTYPNFKSFSDDAIKYCKDKSIPTTELKIFGKDFARKVKEAYDPNGQKEGDMSKKTELRQERI